MTWGWTNEVYVWSTLHGFFFAHIAFIPSHSSDYLICAPSCAKRYMWSFINIFYIRLLLELIPRLNLWVYSHDLRVFCEPCEIYLLVFFRRPLCLRVVVETKTGARWYRVNGCKNGSWTEEKCTAFLSRAYALMACCSTQLPLPE